MGTVASPSDDRSKIVMGYPPINSYPQSPYVYPQPDLGYHNHKGYVDSVSPNPYSQSFDGYYYQQPYEPLVPEPSRTTSVGRAMISLLIVLTIGMCMLSIIIFLLFATDLPDFRIVSLTVPNFNATNSSLVAIWYANITVTNQNEGFKIQFPHVMSSVFYEEDMLAISPLQPFEIETKQNLDLSFRVTTGRSNQEQLHAGVFQNIVQDRSTGFVIFSLRLSLKAQYMSNSFSRKASIKVYCKNLQVSFSPTGEGKLTEDSPNECLTFSQ
ncbi:hydroxyproline-rich glycoprotein family protein [Forsythia ovata]|uniref:Hydroxyproline-rich glycoprotein family protein n=1 Tax=Forsythia ovata TaxID=205694 RepID=A0ABD1WWX2_9LAMI